MIPEVFPASPALRVIGSKIQLNEFNRPAQKDRPVEKINIKPWLKGFPLVFYKPE